MDRRISIELFNPREKVFIADRGGQPVGEGADTNRFARTNLVADIDGRCRIIPDKDDGKTRDGARLGQSVDALGIALT